MRLIIGCAVFAVSFVAGSVDARGFQSDRPMDGYWRCFSAHDTNPIYFTGVWEQRVLATEVHAGFVKFLADKYGYTGRVSCSSATKARSDLAKARADSVALQQHYQKTGMKVIDTGWTLQPSTATAAVKPAQGAPTHWAACRLDRLAPGAKSVVMGPYNIYISDVFPADPKAADVAQTFDAFIDAKYGLERDIPPVCDIRTSEEAVRASHKAWIAEANKIGKAIMTGWKGAQ